VLVLSLRSMSLKLMKLLLRLLEIQLLLQLQLSLLFLSENFRSKLPSQLMSPALLLLQLNLFLLWYVRISHSFLYLG
jgi:hypothetical protein